MSKYMQIDIRIIPFYEKPFEKCFSNIANLLRQRSYTKLVERAASFYEIANALEAIAENPDTPPDLRDTISPYVEKMMRLKEIAREHLLARRLNELDQTLYRIEDVFEELENGF